MISRLIYFRNELIMKIWIYKHYKWWLYEVVWIAKNSLNLEEMVVYKALYDSNEFWNNALWVRSKSSFEEKVILDWREVFRFKYIWKENYKNI